MTNLIENYLIEAENDSSSEKFQFQETKSCKRKTVFLAGYGCGYGTSKTQVVTDAGLKKVEEFQILNIACQVIQNYLNLPEKFINMITIVVYGKGGRLAHHFDELKNFSRPIITLSLKGTKKISFGKKGMQSSDNWFSFNVPQ